MAKAKSANGDIGKKSSSAVTRRTVADVAAAKALPRLSFTPDQRAQVADALEMKDRGVVLAAKDIWQLLCEDYGFSKGVSAFERLVCAEFSRRSWACK